MSDDLLKENRLLHKQYESLVELYKFYLNLALQTSIFFYGITGGIISFYFSQKAQLNMNAVAVGKGQIDVLQFSLVLPIIYSLLFGFLSFRGSYLLKRNVDDHIREICRELKLVKAPDMGTAVIFLRMTAIVYWGVAAAMITIVGSAGLKVILSFLVIGTVTVSLSRWHMWNVNINKYQKGLR